MRRRLAVLVVSACLLAMPGIADAAIAGTACKVLKQTRTASGKRYTCVRVGASLRWDNGRPIAIPARPVPKQPEPTLAERWNATGSNALHALQKISYLSNGVTPQTPITYSFSPTLWPSTRTEMQRRMNNVVAYWDRLYRPALRVYFTAGTYDDLQWACGELNQHDPNRSLAACIADQQSELKNNFHVSRGYDIQGGSENWYLIQSPEVLDRRGYWPRIEHEYWHSVQQDIMGSEFRYNIACWALEGGAEYLGIATATQGDIALFLDQRNRSLQDLPDTVTRQQLRTMTGADFADWFTKASTPWQVRGQWDDNCAPYRSTGMYHFSLLATEWMVDQVGLRGYLDFFKLLRTVPWHTAVEQTFGAPEAKVYAKIGDYTAAEVGYALNNTFYVIPTRS